MKEKQTKKSRGRKKLNYPSLVGKLGAMFAYALAHMEEVGISIKRREEYKLAHRQIRQILKAVNITPQDLEWINSSEEILRFSVKKDWLPTAENINALPEPLRKYIYELETNCDPPTLVRDNIIIKENIKALEIKLKEAEEIIPIPEKPDQRMIDYQNKDTEAEE